MHISKQQFRKLIEGFQFRELFNQLGWNYVKEPLLIEVDNTTFELASVADKNGFRILVCSPGEGGDIPPHEVRFKLDKKISRLYKEHLIIFTDKKETKQTWQLLWSSPGKLAKIYTNEWHKGQDPEILHQKTSGLLFTLDEEQGGITIVDVTQRVADNFHQNNEKVTRDFYERFKKEHTSFLSFIKGIDTAINKDWYGSLMLNRLMFCYFIQKKGFLNNEVHYLRERLKQCKKKKGDGKFYSFYRSFLLVLFHKGLNEPEQNAAIKTEIGKVPYLNGGLFDEHELERNYTDIDIDDEAFERIFDFFDKYIWHLDTRVAATGRDINPDVIGYIFEKYINDRAQMGAYYTKEDITDYISKNCIIPWLFDETARHYPKAFTPNGEIWTALKESGDDYIYEAVKYGVDEPLPPAIEAGIKEVSRRTEWNKPAPATAALPTEIWREVVERRARCAEVREKIDSSAISHINDFITYNLAIRSFAQDVVQQTTDPQFLAQFYKALNRVTILDPTCGSGAFLFAAMNILEPLYDACLVRMEAFIKENGKGKHKFFEEVLSNLNTPAHPNRQYFIYKSIILNNLYGVDIMREAVEIAKLRLFLKLVATVDADYTKPNLGLEPLPDIDFNIRAGNTLIGFATEKQLETGSLDYQNDKKKVKEEMELVGMVYTRFKQLQLKGNQNYVEFKGDKISLQERLNALTEKLDHAYFNAFGDYSLKFEDWKISNVPFHWFAEFYEIIHKREGFDIIIGNPPYVVYTKKDSKTKTSIADKYKIKDLKTLSSNNLYAFIIEHSLKLLSPKSKIGMIIPISGISSDKFYSLQQIFSKSLVTWQSSYSNRPAKLFDDVEQRLTVFIGETRHNENASYFSCSYKHWYSDTREYLFPTLIYTMNTHSKSEIAYSKVGNDLEKSIMKKLLIKSNKKLSHFIYAGNKYTTYYHDGPTYFIRAMSYMPNSGANMKASSHYRCVILSDKLKNSPASILNSSLFYFFFKNFSNCRDFSDREVLSFPIGDIDDETVEVLDKLEKELKKDYERNKELKNRVYDSGLVYYEEFYPSKSKGIIDKIDCALSNHFKFNSYETDYIINYDIKFRMGKEVDDGEDTDTSQIKKTKTNDSNVVGLQIKPELMKEFTVHEGIYFVNDVVDYTGLPADRVRTWFRELVKEDYEGMSGKEQTNVDRLRISFHGLVEFVVIAELRKLGFTTKKIFEARADLGAKTEKIYPFATNDVARLRPILHEDKPAKSELTFDFTSGNVSLNGLGQYNLEFVREFFSHIEFKNGHATKIFGKIDSQLIVIDPEQMGGKACINGKGVEAQVIAMQYSDESSILGIKAQYDVTEQEILEAFTYWNNN